MAHSACSATTGSGPAAIFCKSARNALFPLLPMAMATFRLARNISPALPAIREMSGDTFLHPSVQASATQDGKAAPVAETPAGKSAARCRTCCSMGIRPGRYRSRRCGVPCPPSVLPARCHAFQWSDRRCRAARPACPAPQWHAWDMRQCSAYSFRSGQRLPYRREAPER